MSINKRMIRARIDLLAAERAIPAAEIETAKRATDRDLLDFAIRHDVSLDWLVRGCLKGLLRHLTIRIDAPGRC